MAFRFRYNVNGGSGSYLEVYGLPDRSNWEAVDVRQAMIVDKANGGGLELGSGNWILIRYSVAGMTRIGQATFSVYGRSYSTGSSGSFEAWTPIYGGVSTPQGSFSNAWPYSWSSVDFTGQVRVGDTPGLTGVRLYPRGPSGVLVVNTVELCIDGA